MLAYPDYPHGGGRGTYLAEIACVRMEVGDQDPSLNSPDLL
jgi:hypothetical protein